MANTSEEWFERGISDGHINYHEYDKFTNREIIDVGGFGTVYKHEWQGCELTVALKCLKSNANTNRVFIRELKLLQRLSNHPSIIAFYGITKDNNGCYNMILQYADNGNLREYLKKNFVTLQWKCKLRIAKEIVHGLMFLHNNKIVHRDLHSKNILIHQGQIKITDFGLAKQINEISSTSASAVHGMAAYIDPQYFVNPKFKRNEKSDIYSLGVILWEISSGKPPFKSFELGVVLCAYIVQGHREKPIEGALPQYVELYEQCWDNDPDIRPDTEAILEALNKLISPDTINSTSVQDDITLENMRREAREYFNKARYVEAFELYEKILKNHKHNANDRKNASDWNLSEQNLFSEGANEVIKVLYRNTILTSLNLYYNYIGSKVGINLAEALRINTTLTFLNLSQNKVGSKGGKALAKALCNNTSLIFLDIADNHLGPEGGKAFAELLHVNTSLISLKIVFNQLGPENGEAFAEALCKNKTLTFLSLGWNELGNKGGKALAKAFYENTTLTTLDLYNNQLGSEGGKAFGEVLYMNKSLTSLNLGQNKLGSIGGENLAEALRKNTVLTSLDISRNQLGSKGGKLLLESLCINTALTYLNLASNKLGFEGIKELAKTLRKNTTLTSLDIEDNEVDSEVGKILADSLCENTTLTSLNLRWNKLGSEGGKSLARALCKNNTLTHLNIMNNQLGSKGVRALAKVAFKNTSLISLELKYNKLSINELAKALYKKNKTSFF